MALLWILIVTIVGSSQAGRLARQVDAGLQPQPQHILSYSLFGGRPLSNFYFDYLQQQPDGPQQPQISQPHLLPPQQGLPQQHLLLQQPHLNQQQFLPPQQGIPQHLLSQQPQLTQQQLLPQQQELSQHILQQQPLLNHQAYYGHPSIIPHGAQFNPYYSHQPRPAAECLLKSASESNVTGVIRFFQTTTLEPLQIVGQVSGLSKGKHGFHIHQTGDIDNDCKAAGPHFNPTNATHGGPTDQVRHFGDLGNIEADENGIAAVLIIDPYITAIAGDPRNVIGRAVVVHAGEDDLGKGEDDESKKTGNAGARQACCVIQPPGFF